MRLSEVKAIVTGGASGLGGATTRRLIEGGGRVTICDLPNSKGTELAREFGERAQFVATDVTNEAQVQAAVDVTVRRFGGINVLVNCAGMGMAGRTIMRQGPFPLDLFSKTIE